MNCPDNEFTFTKVGMMCQENFLFVKLLVRQPPGLPDLFLRRCSYSRGACVCVRLQLQ